MLPPLELEARELAFVLGLRLLLLLFKLFTLWSLFMEPAIEAGDGILWGMLGWWWFGNWPGPFMGGWRGPGPPGACW